MKYITFVLLLLTNFLYAQESLKSINSLIISADKVKKYDYNYDLNDLNNLSKKINKSLNITTENTLIINDFNDFPLKKASLADYFEQLNNDNFLLYLLCGPWKSNNGIQELVCNSSSPVSYNYLLNLFEFSKTHNALMIVIYPQNAKPELKEFTFSKDINGPGKHLLLIESKQSNLKDAMSACENIFKEISEKNPPATAYQLTQAFITKANEAKLNFMSIQISNAKDLNLYEKGEDHE